MYHIVPEIAFSIYIIVHWDCHGIVRLVTSNSYIYYFHDREVWFTRRFSILRLPRCHEIGYIQRSYIISTAVRSGLPDGLVFWVCHDVVRLGSPNGHILFLRS